jgi:pimeloyl-ACP methyl ester carboxylesterase
MTTEPTGGCVLHRVGAGTPLVCVPGFADSAVSWWPLADALMVHHEVAVLDLPGFGAAPAPGFDVTVAALAEMIAEIVRSRWAGPVALVGHSLGAALAVRAAQQLPEQCAAVVSIEGNLTAQDGYFSGQATRHNDPHTFKRVFADQVRRLVEDGQAPACYADSVAAADPRSMYTLGRDATTNGAADGFGQEFAALRCPTVYLWSRTTTPPPTQDYLRDHHLPHHRLTIEHHWPWTIRADSVADLVHAAAVTASSSH